MNYFNRWLSVFTLYLGNFSGFGAEAPLLVLKPSGKPARVLDYLGENRPQRVSAHLVGIDLCRAGVFDVPMAVLLLGERALTKAFLLSASAPYQNSRTIFVPVLFIGQQPITAPCSARRVKIRYASTLQ
nr:hypothetical protein [uncultured Rhodoferax sp.]